ncbi:glycosyltransferase family 2 protein [Vibrio harveyi]|uniref:glycosyltransferase family 2 protein n=1 Tax=Vibrio harveyi TaxID=669 RepID=UPI002380618E|nr:glycosyltransferase family 2 protein [Vibrio harveyi]
MKENVLVSVIVPVYNAELFLNKCIESLVNQTYKKIEIICVDDGSSDNSFNVLKVLKGVDSRISIFKKENGGASSARNYALKYASGDFICVLDADDYIETNAIEELLKSALKWGADTVLYNVYFIKNGNAIKFKDVPVVGAISGNEALRRSLNWSIPGIGMYKKTLFENISYDESNLHGDELTSRQLLFSSKVVSFSNAVYYYLQHEDSSTKLFSSKNLEVLDNQLYLYKYLLSINASRETMNLFYEQLLLCVFSVFKMAKLNQRFVTVNMNQKLSGNYLKSIDILKNNFPLKKAIMTLSFHKYYLLSVYSKKLLNFSVLTFLLLKKIAK